MWFCDSFDISSGWTVVEKSSQNWNKAYLYIGYIMLKNYYFNTFPTFFTKTELFRLHSINGNTKDLRNIHKCK